MSLSDTTELDHDTAMCQHAARRGRVRVTRTDTGHHVADGVLIAWRPNRTRPGKSGALLTRSTFAADVLPDGERGTRTYSLIRYHLEVI